MTSHIPDKLLLIACNCMHIELIFYLLFNGYRKAAGAWS